MRSSAQVHAVNREVRKNEGLETLRPLSNLVFMGMGEPLHNFENLKTALAILQSQDGPNFSHRHITVSTVGLVPMIERFGQETDVKLAISLNASTDEQRSKMMPVNRKWNIAALLDACRKFPLRQGRRITFEYVLLRGVNDSDEDAAASSSCSRHPRQGEPDPLQREPRPGLPDHHGRARRGLPGAPGRGPRGGLHPAEPGPGHRGGLRPAGQPGRGRGPPDAARPRASLTIRSVGRLRAPPSQSITFV